MTVNGFGSTSGYQRARRGSSIIGIDQLSVDRAEFTNFTKEKDIYIRRDKLVFKFGRSTSMCTQRSSSWR